MNAAEEREALAAYAHEAWSGWMKYMFEKGTFLNEQWTAVQPAEPGARVLLPAWAVERWTRQMNTPYADLTEEEKESDRAEADKMLAIMNAAEPQLDWLKAKKHLDFYSKTYEELGPTGRFGMALTIMPLQARFDRGERTKWLYDEMMEVE